MRRAQRLVVTVAVTVAGVLGTAAASAGARTIARAAGAKVSLEGIPASKQVAKPKINGSKISIPVGGGKSITWKKGQKAKIAWLTIGESDVYVSNQTKAVASEAKRLGADVTTYDGNFNAQTQLDQLQSVLSSHKYNAIVINPVDPSQVCTPLTKTAPKENILVEVIVGPICGRFNANGAKTWAPGTLNFVGGDGQPSAYEAYFKQILTENPGKQSIGLVVGPQTNEPSINAVNAMKAALKSDQKAKLVGTYYTDYSAQQAQQVTQDLLRAHPETSIIVDTSAEMSVGVEAGLSSSGNSKVKFYDKGGSTYEVGLIKQGKLLMDMPQYPVTNGKAGVDALILATQGKTVPRYLGNDGHVVGAGAPPYVTKKNIGSFKPEYSLGS